MVLIEADGSLVTKDELLNRVWPGIVVEPGNLKVQIAALRKALGGERDFIRTECGRGYRFTAAVRSTAAAQEWWSMVDGIRSSLASEAISPTDLSEIAARLTCLEDRLTEVLNLLTTQRRSSRLRRRHQKLLPARPAKASGGHTDHLTEMTRQVALVREARRQRDFG